MRTELIENGKCKCGHSEEYHKVDGEFTMECTANTMKGTKCECAEYDELRA